MNRWVRFSGIVGVILVLFGILGTLIGFSPTNLFGDPLLSLHLIGGILFLIFWTLTVGFKKNTNPLSVVKGRATRFGANALVYTVIVLGILITANWLAHRHEKRWDLTEQGVYSLSDGSKKIINGLKKPLKAVAFKVTEDTQALSDLLDLYRAENPSNVSTSLVDPRAKFNLVEQYGMKAGNVLYLQYGSDEDPKKGISRINETSEEAVTNAIIKLARGDAKKIYYVTGHEEPDLKGGREVGYMGFAQAIGDEHLTVDPLVLGANSKIPDDAAALILAAPKKELLPEEKQLLIQYADNGGRLILLTDPRAPKDIQEIADHFGIKVGNNVVIDQIQRLFSAPSLGAQPIVQQYGAHPITTNFNQNNVTIFSLASSVTGEQKAPEGVTYTELLKTSATSWAESDLAKVFDSGEPSAEKGPDDIAGPVSLAVAYEKKGKADPGSEKKEGEEKFDKVARVVVFGDSDFINNANLKLYSNRDLILNAVNWVVGEEGGISIRPKSMRASSAQITMNTFWTMLRASLVIPELILLLGLVIWWKRKEVVA